VRKETGMIKKTRSAAKKVAQRPKTGARVLAKLAPGHTASELQASLKDILGVVPSEITLAFKKKMSPGGIRAGDGSWSGNVYKYRY
jgi:hypothetical protein